MYECVLICARRTYRHDLPHMPIRMHSVVFWQLSLILRDHTTPLCLSVSLRCSLHYRHYKLLTRQQKSSPHEQCSTPSCDTGGGASAVTRNRPVDFVTASFTTSYSRSSDKTHYPGFFQGQFELAFRASKLVCVQVKWLQATSLPKGRARLGGGGLPRKILKFDVAKRPFYALLMLRASHFSSPDIPKKRSYSNHLPETLTEDVHFNDTL